MDCVIVSHTHWDREWYRTFQAFRARLVDTVDAVLDLLDRDPGWSFVLDGQTIVSPVPGVWGCGVVLSSRVRPSTE